ncbi:MAG: PilN domain-containing protein [Planctomycetota bacterium]
MARTDCILELTPSRMRVVMLDGSSAPEIASHELDVDWGRCWEKNLLPLRETLGSLVEELEGTPVRMHVVYMSPHATSDIVSFPTGARADQSAVTLAAHDVLHIDSADQPLSVQPLVMDSDARDDAQRHLLVSTDHDEHTEAVVGLVHSVGCRMGNIQPMHAYVLRHTTPTRLGDGEQQVQARITIGEHTTTLSVFDSERLYLVRTIEIGLYQLIEMIVRQLRVEGQSNEEARRDAWGFLLARGVPMAFDTIDEQRGIMGRDLLPMIQPVLQRIFVEIKQSLRFGVPRESLEGARITISGPGALVPRLGELLDEHLDLGVECETTSDRDLTGDNLERALSMVTTHGCARPESTLTSTQRVRTLTLRRVRKGLVAGTLAASLAVLVNTSFQYMDARDSLARIDSLEPQLSSIKEARFQFEQAGELHQNMEAMRASLDQFLDARPSWSVFLHMLSGSVPPTIQLTEIRGETQGDVPGVRLEGIEYQSAESNAIQEFLRTLQASPLVDDVTLGGTHRTDTEQGDARQFSLTITLIPADLQEWANDR